MKIKLLILFLCIGSSLLIAQKTDPVIEGMIKEATENSQLEILGHELTDLIGPRLVGTPQMQHANEWAVAKYNDWGISARNEKWGEWRGW